MTNYFFHALRDYIDTRIKEAAAKLDPETPFKEEEKAKADTREAWEALLATRFMAAGPTAPPVAAATVFPEDLLERATLAPGESLPPGAVPIYPIGRADPVAYWIPPAAEAPAPPRPLDSAPACRSCGKHFKEGEEIRNDLCLKCADSPY
jgi:hypothetical protein